MLVITFEKTELPILLVYDDRRTACEINNMYRSMNHEKLDAIVLWGSNLLDDMALLNEKLDTRSIKYSYRYPFYKNMFDYGKSYYENTLDYYLVYVKPEGVNLDIYHDNLYPKHKPDGEPWDRPQDDVKISGNTRLVINKSKICNHVKSGASSTSVIKF